MAALHSKTHAWGETVELQDYWRVVRRRWRTIVVCLLACLGGSVVLTLTTTPVYESSARLFISTAGEQDPRVALARAQLAPGRAAAYVDLVPTGELAELVGARLDLSSDQVERLPDQVQAIVLPGTFSIQLTVTDSSSSRAQGLAEAYASELQGLIRDLETPKGGGAAPFEATVVEHGTLNATPISPRPLRNVVLSIALGLLLGMAAAAVREVIDKTVKSHEQASQISGS